jgi:plasmid stabilization system protein ParE
MNLEILPAAERDLTDGFWFYERQEAGLGHYFRESLIGEIESLLTCGGVHRRLFGWHRLLARRFPYAVNYSVHEQTVLIRAVLDCRRDPSWTRRKLR